MDDLLRGLGETTTTRTYAPIPQVYGMTRHMIGDHILVQSVVFKIMVSVVVKRVIREDCAQFTNCTYRVKIVISVLSRGGFWRDIARYKLDHGFIGETETSFNHPFPVGSPDTSIMYGDAERVDERICVVAFEFASVCQDAGR